MQQGHLNNTRRGDQRPAEHYIDDFDVRERDIIMVEHMLMLADIFNAKLSEEEVIQICVDNDFKRSEVTNILKRYEKRHAPVEDEWTEVRSASEVSAHRRNVYNNKEQYRYHREVQAKRDAGRRNYEESKGIIHNDEGKRSPSPNETSDLDSQGSMESYMTLTDG